MPWPKERRLIGKKHPRIDGPAKATGTAIYSYDKNRPGMLHALIYRSPYAHARIKEFDLDAAAAMPGVKAIHVIGIGYAGIFAGADARKITVRVKQGEDQGEVVKVDGQKITIKAKDGDKTIEVNDNIRLLKDGAAVRPASLKENDKIKVETYVERSSDLARGTRLLKEGKAVTTADLKPGDNIVVEAEKDAIGRELFYAGDEIVALAADTEDHARDAIRAIKIDFQELEHFVKEEDALANPQAKTVGPRPNVGAGGAGTTGNVENAYKEADAVVEGEYGVATICHQCLESHGLVAEWEGENLTVWCSTQAVFGTAADLARTFSIPTTQVKCITHYMGGGFGSKFGADVQGMAAAHLAKKAGAPVKLMLTREDEITTAGNRPSAYGTVKIAGKKDGSITAYEVDCFGTPGVGAGATVNMQLLPYPYAMAPTVIPNVKKKHTVVRLNTGGARAMRAPGHPQNCVLTECAVDDLAAKLDLDPMQVRLKNLPPNEAAKDPQAFNALRNTVYTEEIKIAANLSEWEKKWHKPGEGGNGPIKHGIGMAIHTWGGIGFGPNDTKVTINSDGSVLFESSTQDLGTGQRTVSAIVVAEVLGLEPKDITVRLGESQWGNTSGSGGSTTCPSQAPSAFNSATGVLAELFDKIAPRLGAKKEDLAVEPGKVVDKANNKSWPWKEACAKLGMDTVSFSGKWSAGLSNVNVGGVQVAEVSVDTETGVVRCTKIVAVQDCGMVINKQGTESQLAGGVIMGLNYALFEERIMDRKTGRQVNPDMEFYKLGGMKDMPQIITHMHDMPERGVIGIGEPCTISTAAAVGNAVFNAIGVRVPHTPYTPDRVLAALSQKKGGKG